MLSCVLLWSGLVVAEPLLDNPPSRVDGFLRIPWNTSVSVAEKTMLMRPNTIFVTQLIRQNDSLRSDFFNRYYGEFGKIPAIIDQEFAGSPGKEKFVYGMAFMPQPENNIRSRYEYYAQKLTDKYGQPNMIEKDTGGLKRLKWFVASGLIPVSVTLSVKKSAYYTDDPDIPEEFKGTNQGIAVEYRYNDLTKKQLTIPDDEDL